MLRAEIVAETNKVAIVSARCRALIEREAQITFLSADEPIVGDPRVSVKEEFACSDIVR